MQHNILKCIKISVFKYRKQVDFRLYFFWVSRFTMLSCCSGKNCSTLAGWPLGSRFWRRLSERSLKQDCQHWPSPRSSRQSPTSETVQTVSVRWSSNVQSTARSVERHPCPRTWSSSRRATTPPGRTRHASTPLAQCSKSCRTGWSGSSNAPLRGLFS